ncbi:MAG: WecB/TagA/CpsF family glycosyltransferase [Marinilabiliaceae bacterium]|nr:WecB/TagA/CpsF family glycosyltransferase [Marinilabiliaceae bacterium]
MTQKVRILNIDIQNITRKELLENLSEGIFFTPNVDHLVKLQKDAEFYNVYQNADWVVCDSKIVAIGLKFLRTSIKEVIQGSSFFTEYYLYHKNNENVKIFLLGAAKEVAETAMLKINAKVGRNIVVGAHSPSFGFENDETECQEIVHMINTTNANVLLVGVGAPKQEKWIFKYKDLFTNIKLFMALGATIDFEAGKVKRAPKIFQKFAIEWLFRMCSDPKRLIKRYLIDDMAFFYYLLKQKLGLYQNPF